MIQNAMRQIHYGVTLNKSAKSQVFVNSIIYVFVCLYMCMYVYTKALEVIRKLKDVMPIARASMLLRVVTPQSGIIIIHYPFQKLFAFSDVCVRVHIHAFVNLLYVLYIYIYIYIIMRSWRRDEGSNH